MIAGRQQGEPVLVLKAVPTATSSESSLTAFGHLIWALNRWESPDYSISLALRCVLCSRRVSQLGPSVLELDTLQDDGVLATSYFPQHPGLQVVLDGGHQYLVSVGERIAIPMVSLPIVETDCAFAAPVPLPVRLST